MKIQIESKVIVLTNSDCYKTEPLNVTKSKWEVCKINANKIIAVTENGEPMFFSEVESRDVEMNLITNAIKVDNRYMALVISTVGHLLLNVETGAMYAEESSLMWVRDAKRQNF